MTTESRAASKTATPNRTNGQAPNGPGPFIGQAYGRRIHAREVMALDDAGEGLCWVQLERFGDTWLLIRSDGRDVSRAVRKLRQIPDGEASARFPAL